MCKCTPNIKTPLCGKIGCTYPKQDNFICLVKSSMGNVIEQMSFETAEEVFIYSLQFRRGEYQTVIYKKVNIKVELA
jgi:hypothetical protein